jgi:hypothetical protein
MVRRRAAEVGFTQKLGCPHSARPASPLTARPAAGAYRDSTALMGEIRREDCRSVTPDIWELLDKASNCLARARIILGAGE